MIRLPTLLVLTCVFGCSTELSTQTPTPTQPQPRAAESNRHAITVLVDLQGDSSVGNLSISEKDWPQLVNQWGVTTAVIDGDNGSKFSDLLKVQADLKNAGVPNVIIAKPGD